VAITTTYIAQDSYEPTDVMVREADFITPGVVTADDLTLTASGSSLEVTVSGSAEDAVGGNCWLPGGYRLNNSAALALTLAAADATNPRIDLVEAGIDTGTDPYTPEIIVKTGTPASSPSAPSVDTGYIALWQVEVPANATVPGTLTDVRPVASPMQGVYSALPAPVGSDGTRVLVYASGVLTEYIAVAGVWEAQASQSWVTTQLADVSIPLATSPPPSIGQTNMTGTSTTAARADHTHQGVTSFGGRNGAVSPASGDYTAAQVGAIDSSAAGVANGVATLDGSAQVPVDQLGNVPDATTAAAGLLKATFGASGVQTALVRGNQAFEASIGAENTWEDLCTLTATQNGLFLCLVYMRLPASAEIGAQVLTTDGGGPETVPMLPLQQQAAGPWSLLVAVVPCYADETVTIQVQSNLTSPVPSGAIIPL